jgi:hypothetical protein
MQVLWAAQSSVCCASAKNPWCTYQHIQEALDCLAQPIKLATLPVAYVGCVAAGAILCYTPAASCSQRNGCFHKT